MASTKTSTRLLDQAQFWAADFDPNATADTLVTLNKSATEKCIAIADARAFVFGIFKSVGTTAIASARIVAATSAAGAGATTVKAFASTQLVAAVGDYVRLSVDVEEIREVLATATHAGLYITLGASGDECVPFCAKHGRHEYAGLGADYLA